MDNKKTPEIYFDIAPLIQTQSDQQDVEAVLALLQKHRDTVGSLNIYASDFRKFAKKYLELLRRILTEEFYKTIDDETNNMITSCGHEYNAVVKLLIESRRQLFELPDLVQKIDEEIA